MQFVRKIFTEQQTNFHYCINIALSLEKISVYIYIRKQNYERDRNGKPLDGFSDNERTRAGIYMHVCYEQLSLITRTRAAGSAMLPNCFRLAGGSLTICRQFSRDRRNRSTRFFRAVAHFARTSAILIACR